MLTHALTHACTRNLRMFLGSNFDAGSCKSLYKLRYVPFCARYMYLHKKKLAHAMIVCKHRRTSRGGAALRCPSRAKQYFRIVAKFLAQKAEDSSQKEK